MSNELNVEAHDGDMGDTHRQAADCLNTLHKSAVRWMRLSYKHLDEIQTLEVENKRLRMAAISTRSAAQAVMAVWACSDDIEYDMPEPMKGLGDALDNTEEG